jgi:hypothetical protein
MISQVVVIYLSGWVVASLGLYAAGRRLSDDRAPAPNPLAVSIAAGAVWPLLLVGLVELSSVVVFTRFQSKPGSEVGIYA